jgi:hypothetical protein
MDYIKACAKRDGEAPAEPQIRTVLICGFGSAGASPSLEITKSNFSRTF